ncbi:MULTISPECIES: helix-turn-helix domain-containing protein [unclassified Paenibacillus]|uniref:TetR/AcrR family transcriptional regulator n=1 Tax=unclassified Paenibacillus TaxID=185978 RepID=UPI000970567F|nr:MULTISPECIES: helix-turn-helix domain-containing protein [unclassified Paenibacillus]
METDHARGDLRSTKERLLYAAVDLIAEQGYKGITTKVIAAAAGMSEMTLFRHFAASRVCLKKRWTASTMPGRCARSSLRGTVEGRSLCRPSARRRLLS